MNCWLAPHIAAMSGYTPGEQPAPGTPVIKLNTNESPYPPSPAVWKALGALAASALQRYPDPLSGRLRDAAAGVWGHFGVGADHVLVGNGSDDLLTILWRATTLPGRAVAFPWPTYSLYQTLCDIQDAVAVKVPWQPGWQLPTQALVAAGAALTVVANPNAPSGTFAPVASLQTLAEALALRPGSQGGPGLLVLDEAYADFAPDTALRLAVSHPNVVVLRTLSKSYALAGARVGLAVTAPQTIRELRKVKDSYNLDAMAETVAAAALADSAHLAATVGAVRAERARLSAGLTALGFEVVPSQANFVLAYRRDRQRADSLYQQLKAQGILVRYFDRPELDTALRISVGRPEETDTLLAALAKLLPSPAQLAP